MNTPSDEKTTKRRRVRKGTHSCWECRRRKVKCTFASLDDVRCVTCVRRRAKCVSQEDADGPDEAENDTTRIEQTKKIYDNQFGIRAANDNDSQPNLHHGVIGSGMSTTCSAAAENGQSSSLAYLMDESPSRRTQHSPNMLVTPECLPTPASSLATFAEPKKYMAITHTLLCSLPPRRDIEILVGRIRHVSALCYQSNYKCRSRNENAQPQVLIPLANLLHPESHPVLLARQMLLFAAGVQYLSPNEVIPGLTEHHYTIMESLAESAIKMVTTNDSLVGTLEGLENIILEAFFHIDSGNIRRAWITMRRAVTVAQLLGLDRQGHYRFKLLSQENELDPEMMWICVVSMERSLSLLLGLPTSTGMHIPTVKACENKPVSSCISTLVIDVTAKILQRNEVHDHEKASAITREIGRELIDISKNLPSEFWKPLNFAGLEIDSTEAFWETRRTWDHMCYYNLVAQLHLPYAMCPGHNSQTISSRIACANACREILTREITFRKFNPITASCRMADFLALVAGMAIILAHIVSHCRQEVDDPLVHQRLGDRAAVEEALDCMRSMSELREDMLAARCAALLKHLLVIEADAAQGQRYRIDRLEPADAVEEDDRNVLVIKVPYVGGIRFTREGNTPMAPLHIASDRGLVDGVRIGGIGSVHISNKSALNEMKSDSSANMAINQAMTTRTSHTPSMHDYISHVPQIMPGDMFSQHNQMFPDAAAGMDDWVFQGFDTAFFDTLIRGATNQQQIHGAEALYAP
ncbi:uncharacterized protein PV09_05750 [Verruconis gallopava]|uniref:Zn(2)-C6 fungal-type domain-containing protein n=1 Tax=Verruconis gallopava TaxID=253628 RepID=A0A0D2A972_9PEZI|nr:uncharacterized protein PV09_05750 [Verruconis gallopava]KIW03105.1 hypothetical protein PV09_05750 [Verruconis gallopava]